MSFSAMAWATKQKVPATQKLVLLMLASMADNDRGICWPKHSTLAEDCSLSPRSIKDQLKALESAGLIEIIHRAIDGVQLSNAYRLKIVGVGNLLPGGEAVDSRGVGNLLPPGGHQLPTDTVIEPISLKQSNDSIPPQAAFEIPEWVDRETWDGLIEVRKKCKAANTALALKQLLKSLQDHSGADRERAKAVMTQSIINSWKGVFPLKQPLKDEPQAQCGQSYGRKLNFDEMRNRNA